MIIFVCAPGVEGQGKGYIVMQRDSNASAGAGAGPGAEAAVRADGESGIANMFDDFTPFLLAQHRGRKHATYATFDEAIDEFFGQFEIQQLSRVQGTKMSAADKKRAKAMRDQEQRAAALTRVRDHGRRCADAIIYNMPLVEAAMGIVNAALAESVVSFYFIFMISYE